MKRAYNILQVIKAIVDDGEFFELKAKFARNLVIGFGRLDGYPVGFVANQPMFLAGSLDVDASDKAARFIRFCDAFNIPGHYADGRPRFLSRKAARGERHHPPRRENALRLRRGDGAENHDRATQGLWRRQAGACARAKWVPINCSFGPAWN